MPRADLSQHLIHWTRGESSEEAFERLFAIVSSRVLLGGQGFIKGGFKCVCFTEAPRAAFRGTPGRYRPFGVEVTKEWLFHQGGRPVIYQPDDEYVLLHPDQQWRHVRYEPGECDFTWEREWRIQTEALPLAPGACRIIVPEQHYADELSRRHLIDQEQDLQLRLVPYEDEWWMVHTLLEPLRYDISVLADSFS